MTKFVLEVQKKEGVEGTQDTFATISAYYESNQKNQNPKDKEIHVSRY